MERSSAFSYSCNQCGRCCREQVITLSPYDVIRIARAANLMTSEAIERYTLRRGSLLKFGADGRCVALDSTRCTIHQGRPLACRLYPLGLHRGEDRTESYIRLDPASGSLGEYGTGGTVAVFLAGQGTEDYLKAVERYRQLLALINQRIELLVDFDSVEPREFWRIARREALAEQNLDSNPLIDALFDADKLAPGVESLEASIQAHIATLETMIATEADAATLAAAGVMLAISLGYPPRVSSRS
ncbi:MAG TPA: YkgJ family cysteine cluster protein [Candidatus Binataceae bacterium]|nr:YkgJ family cysteine cluster protein [Candidatus Binataceae bacterium]